MIGAVEVLPSLFGEVYVPGAVVAELGHVGSPEAVKAWIAALPDWLVVRESDQAVDLGRLDLGETMAIALAEELGAAALLIDERAGHRVAVERGLQPIGTLGVLARAADRGLVDLPRAVERLLATNFRVSRGLIDSLLARHGQGPP